MNPRQSRDSGILCPGPEFFFENSLSRCSLQKGFRARGRPPSGSTLSRPVQTAAPAQRPAQDSCARSQRATHKALWPVPVGTRHSPSRGQVATGVGGGAGESLEPSIRPGRGLGPPRSWDIGTAGRGCCINQEGRCRLESRPYRPLSEGKGRRERQPCRAPPPLPARPPPALLVTHSHFTPRSVPQPSTSSVTSDEKVDYVQVDKEKTQALQSTMQEWTDVRQSSEPSKGPKL